MRYSDWELSGVLVRMGDEICRLCGEYNKDLDLYGYQSMERKIDFVLIRQAVRMFKCYDKFSVVFEKHGHYYRKIFITYDGEECGLPWFVSNSGD